MPEERRIGIVEANGEIANIPESYLDSAISAGARRANESDFAKYDIKEKYNGLIEQELKSFAQGAAKSIPFVGGRVIEKVTDPEARKAREELYPEYVAAGELAGVLGQSMIPASAIGKVAAFGKAAEGAGILGSGASALSRIGNRAIGAAVEGGIYNLGRTVNEADLGDTYLTAEQALAAFGTGAVLGGATGGLFKLGQELAPAAARAATKISVGEVLKNSADVAGDLKVGWIPGVGSIKDAVIGKIEELGVFKAIQKAQEATVKKIETGSSSIFKSSAAPYIATAVDKPLEEHRDERKEDFKTVQDRLVALSSNPELFQSVLEAKTDLLFDYAPNITAGVQAGMVRMVSYLTSILPKPPPTQPLDEKWEPTQTQIYDFFKSYRAVNEPTSILRQVANGTLTKQAIDAVKAVHPELYLSMQTEVLDKMVQKKDKLPYKTKEMLSLFFGVPLTSSVDARTILANQVSLHSPSRQSGENQVAVRPTQKGLDKLTIAQRSLTPMQRANQRAQE